MFKNLLIQSRLFALFLRPNSHAKTMSYIILHFAESKQ